MGFQYTNKLLSLNSHICNVFLLRWTQQFVTASYAFSLRECAALPSLRGQEKRWCQRALLFPWRMSSRVNVVSNPLSLIWISTRCDYGVGTFHAILQGPRLGTPLRCWNSPVHTLATLVYRPGCFAVSLITQNQKSCIWITEQCPSMNTKELVNSKMVIAFRCLRKVAIKWECYTELIW